jgi:parallel beta-helix repeat protein
MEPLETRTLLSAGPPDRFEPDETLLAAADIGVGPGVHLPELTVHEADDQDWYRFEVLRPDSLDVKIAFDPGQGDLLLEVTDAVGTVLAFAGPTAECLAASLADLAPGTYYVHVAGVGGATNDYSLSIDPSTSSSTRVFFVNDEATTDDYYTLAPGDNANDGLSAATPKATVQGVLAAYDLGPTDLVVIDTGGYSNGTVLIAAEDEAAAYVGTPAGSDFNYGGTRWELADADFNLIYGLRFTGSGGTGIYVRADGANPSTDNTLRANQFPGTDTAITLSGGSGNVLYDNRISGSGTYGVVASDGGSTTLYRNDISGRTVGISLAWSGPASVYDNDLHHNTTGLYAGYSAKSVYGNRVHHNTTGIEGYGDFGGADWSAGQPNDVYANATGIRAWSGSVAFNKVHHNSVGIQAGNSVTVAHNLIYRNTGQGVLVDGAAGVTIESNTIYTPAGSGVVVRNASQNAHLKNNILWTNSGYDLYVATDSQRGFASDYNNLYTSGGGTLVWWQKPFTDLFDWQSEADYDTHSIGYTELHPTVDDPRFVNLAGDDYHLTADPLSTSIDAGDPLSPFRLELGSNGQQIDLGAYGNTSDASLSPQRFLRIDYPEYYTDWPVNQGRPILWHSYDSAAPEHALEGLVDIDLYRVGAGKVADITPVPVPVRDGAFAWSPQASGIVANTGYRYQIRLTWTTDGSINDQSREVFSIPDESENLYYVNDGDRSGDEYTDAPGSNRNTGTTAGDPKANLLPLLRLYDLGPGDEVRMDTGHYVHVRNVVLSNTLGLGNDEGMRITGPVGHAAVIDRANPNPEATNIELNDADYVTLEHLTLRGANRGLWVHNGSTYFAGKDLTASDNTQDGIYVEGDAQGSDVDALTAFNNGGTGIYVATPVASVSNSTVHHNATGMSLSTSAATRVEHNVAYANGTGMSVYSPSGLPTVIGNADLALNLGNKVYGNQRGIQASANVLVAGNTVYENSEYGIYVAGATAARNVVYGNGTGIEEDYAVASTILENRVYANTGTGIRVRYDTIVQGNVVYSNALGIEGVIGPWGTSFTGTIANNLVYANANQGIKVSYGSGAEIVNNTVYQRTGDAVRVESSSNTSLRNNVLWVESGYDLSVAADSQVGFHSDYNLLYVTGAGRTAFWQNTPRASFAAWQNTAFTDQNSLAQDPLFVDRDGSDGLLGYVDQARDGRDDDFHVRSLYGSYHGGSLAPVLDAATGLPAMLVGVWNSDTDQSPAIDRGDAADSFANEPAPNGGYVNLGAYGNTAQASKSPVDYLMITRPDGGEVWPADQTFQVRWRANGFGAHNALDFDGVDDFVSMGDPAGDWLDLGADATIEAWVRFDALPSYSFFTIASKDGGPGGQNKWILGYANNYAGIAGATMFHVNSPGGSVFLSSAPWTPQVGQWYHLALVKRGDDYDFYRDGQWDGSAGTAVFVTDVAAAFEIGRAENNFYFNGAIDEVRLWNVGRVQAEIQDGMNAPLPVPQPGLAAYWQFDEGAGTTTADATANHLDGALGGGVAASRPAWVASHAPLSTVRLDLMETVGENSALVREITASTPNDGNFDWHIPPDVAPGTAYRVRVARTDDAVPPDQSNETFEITGPIEYYYVNDGSVNAEGDWTTAPGDDGNDGLDPGRPKASVRAVLEAYDLGPRSIILVDEGTYPLFVNMVIAEEDSGVTIIGYSDARYPERHALLDRGNTAGGSYVVELAGADGVTLENLWFSGAYYGVYGTTGSDDLSITGCTIFNNAHTGIWLSGNADVSIAGNTVYGHNLGISVGEAARAEIVGNEVYGNATGISAGESSLAPADGMRVADNRVYHNSQGIQVAGDVRASGNRVYSHTGWGMDVGSGATAQGNTAYDNSVGIEGDYYASFILDNHAFANRDVGIRVRNEGLVEGNVVYSNPIGIDAYWGPWGSRFTGTINNNLVYANVNEGIKITAGQDAEVVNNTVYQPTGDALRVEYASNTVVRNNVLWVQSGYDLSVADEGRAGLASDYNDLYATAPGKTALWEGREYATRLDWFWAVGQDAHSHEGDPDGRDAVLGFSRDLVPGTEQWIDDGDPGFHAAGDWTAGDPGYGADSLQATGNDGGNVATWTFTGLDVDSPYELAVTWPARGDLTWDARFEVFDGEARIATVPVDQRYAPTGFDEGGVTWQRLGTYWTGHGRFTVRLTNATAYGVVADAVRIQRLVGDRSADNDFLVTADSPTVDRGSPGDLYLVEPWRNGGRVNQGHTGNTADAAAIPAPLVQVVSPNGWEKLEADAQTTIEWRTAGLLDERPVALINAGGKTVENWSYDRYRTVASGETAFTDAVDTSGLADPAPQAVYQSYAYAEWGVGNRLAWDLPVPNGDYTVRLHFAEPGAWAPGVRVFDVMLQGATVRDDYDIFAETGSMFRAATLTSSVSATDGGGILVELVNQTNERAVLSGIEVWADAPGGIAGPTFTLELSTDSGVNWAPIAVGQSVDRFGRGDYAWTPTAAQVTELQDNYGNTALVRVTAEQGATPPQDTSDDAFLIANSGSGYYVNDDVQPGDQFAQGDDRNSGKRRERPMRTLAALLAAYDLDPGDVVRVDAGNYPMARNVVLGEQDSGVRISGPIGGRAVLDRGKALSDCYVIEMAGADQVTIDHLGLSGAYLGVYATAGSDDLTLLSSEVFGNSSYGISLTDAARARAIDNDVYNNGTGIVASESSLAPADGMRIEINRVHHNSQGVQIWGDTTASGNWVYSHTAWGIDVGGGATAQGNNAVYDNSVGIEGEYYMSYILDNHVFGNRDAGIRARHEALVTGNVVYSNPIGIDGYWGSWGTAFSGTIANNLVYGNANQGIKISAGQDAEIINNTVYQEVGDAVRLEYAANTAVRSNILWGRAGYDLSVADSARAGLGSDYNALYATDLGKVAFWEGHEFATRLDWFWAVGQDEHSHSLGAGANPAVPDPRLTDPDGADDVLGVSRQLVPGTQRIIDDGDVGFQATGTWSAGVPGHGADSLEANGADGSSVATWTFSGLEAGGLYEVAVTWPERWDLAWDAPFVVLDGTARAATVPVDQRYAPSDFQEDGVSWRRLGTYWTSSGQLTVRLANTASGGTTVVADAVRIQRLVGNRGGDDDFRPLADSPTIDRGSPEDYYLAEPWPNGGRVNQGHTGNTSEAVASPAALVQVISPNGWEKLEAQQQTTIEWRTAGLLDQRPVALVNAGGDTVENWSYDHYRTTLYGQSTFADAVDITGVADPAPRAVYQSYAYAEGGKGKRLTWELPVPNGNYTVRLHFADPGAWAPGVRLFDVNLQGATVREDYDIFAEVGSSFRAATLSYAVAATGGTGILVELVNETDQQAVLSGIEVWADPPGGSPSPTFAVEVSTDGGLNWTPLAAGQAVDRFGRGACAWVPTAAQITENQGDSGNTALVRVTAEQGPATQDASDEAFLIANDGNQYYVNDAEATGDVWTSTLGDDRNSGKDPARPMRTLAALVAAYDLDPGDVVRVDTGNYAMARNVLLTDQDSGVKIEGPAATPANLERGNRLSGSYVVELAGADDVTLDHLGLTGAYDGVLGGAGSDRLRIEACRVFDHQRGGISLTGDADAAISGNEVYSVGDAGISLSDVPRARVEGNHVHDNATGIVASGYYWIPADFVRIADNHVHHNGQGIQLSGDIVASGNRVYGHTYWGIQAVDRATAQANLVYANAVGIDTSWNQVSVLENRVFANTGAGIIARHSALVRGNVVYSNSVGIEGTWGAWNIVFTGDIVNNLVYANTNQGINLVSGTGVDVLNNTVYQEVGEAVRVDNSPNTTVRNNVLWIDTGHDIYLADNSQAGFSSDYNLLYRRPRAVAHAGWFNGASQHTLADWQAASAQDAHSKEDYPDFVDVDGPDDILGYRTEEGGYDGGPDDNFYLSPHSPAIDSADASVAPAADLPGLGRWDDPDTPNPGPGYVDMGAYEFRGSSNDAGPPRVVSTFPTAIDLGGATSLSITQISLGFSEEVNPIDANLPANYRLHRVEDGQDFMLAARCTGTSVTLDLGLGGEALPPGTYQFTVHGGAVWGIRDAAANWLDGDADGVAGGDYLRTFVVALPATRVWTGSDPDDGLWSSPENWGGTAPNPGDRLVFAGALRLANENDFPAGTTFRSITFTGDGFELSGNLTTLAPDSDGLGVVNGAAGAANHVGLPIGLLAPTTIAVTAGAGALHFTAQATIDTGAHALTFDADAGAEGRFDGQIRGSGPLLKHGLGVQVLSGANEFTGGTAAHQGTVLVTAVAGLPTGGALNIGAGATVVLASDLTISGAAAGAATSLARSIPAPIAAAGIVVDSEQATSASSSTANSGPLVSAPAIAPLLAVVAEAAQVWPVLEAASVETATGAGDRLPTTSRVVVGPGTAAVAYPRRPVVGPAQVRPIHAKAHDAVHQSTSFGPRGDLAWLWAVEVAAGRKQLPKKNAGVASAVDEALAAYAWHG